MRAFLPFIILLTSCSSYQYLTIDGFDTQKTGSRDFFAENDSVRIQYNFNGADAPINLAIENKTDVPIYVDWSRSALIVDNKAISYRSNVVPINGIFDGSTYGEYVASSASFSALATLPDYLDFIPPGSYIHKSPMSLTNQLVIAPDSAFHSDRVTLVDGSMAKVSHARFTWQSSPLRFKSYLTLIFGDRGNKPIAYQSSFFVSEIYNTVTEPENFPRDRERGDQFYVKENTGAAQGFGVVAGVPLLSTTAALESRFVNNSSQ